MRSIVSRMWAEGYGGNGAVEGKSVNYTNAKLQPRLEAGAAHE
jgi:hypothetical protein